MYEVRLNLGVDSREYEILYEAALNSSDAAGASVEIGVREGGGSELIMRATDQKSSPRVHIAIDPWGDLPYLHDGQDTGYRYTDGMRLHASVGLHRLAAERNLNVIIFAMRDTDFFERFADGVPFYCYGRAQKITEYSLVHFDGPHNIEDIMPEVNFFGPRMSIGSYWVFDDIDLYDHDHVETMVLADGFELVRKGVCKASYRKVS